MSVRAGSSRSVGLRDLLLYWQDIACVDDETPEELAAKLSKLFSSIGFYVSVIPDAEVPAPADMQGE